MLNKLITALLIFGIGIGNLYASSINTIYISTDVPVNIPASSTSTITSTVTVSGNQCISDINILNLNISHTWINDLEVTLTSPDGTTVTLLDHICWSQNNILMSFDDTGAPYNSIPCPPNGGSYQPNGVLGAFNGENSAGVWTLRIRDTYPLDGGSLNGWSLEVITEPCPSPEICNNGIDDDFDGYVDCNDLDCFCQADCIFTEDCTDGLDNDCDGLVDILIQIVHVQELQ